METREQHTLKVELRKKTFRHRVTGEPVAVWWAVFVDAEPSGENLYMNAFKTEAEARADCDRINKLLEFKEVSDEQPESCTGS